MLDPNVLRSVIGVTQDLSSKNIALSPVPDTPLSLIVRTTPTLGMDPTASYDDTINRLVDASRDPQHAALMQDTVQTAAAAVRRSLDYTRNTVMPHVRRVLELYTSAMANLTEPGLPYEMNIVYLPKAYKTEAAWQFVSRWANAPVMPPPPAVMLGSYSPEEVLQLAQLTDDGGFNLAIQDLLSASNGKGLGQIVNVLNGTNPSNQIDDIYTLPLAMVILNLDTPKGGVNMTLTDYNSVRAVIANVAGKRAAQLISASTHALNNNILYSGIVQVPGVVNLTGEVYKSLLEQGLSAEVVLGNELLGRQYRGLQLIDPDNIERCLAAYNRDRAIRQEAAAQNRRQASRQALLNVLREDQRVIAADGAFPVEGDTAEASWGRLRDFMDKVMKTVFADSEPSMIIGAAICAVWYGHTDAWRVIDIMLSIEKTNTGLPAKEVATLATLRYIAEWVACQIGQSYMGDNAVAA